MIIRSRHVLLVLVMAGLCTACSEPAGNAPVADTNANAAAPTAEALLALDEQAAEAYAKGDGRFFEGFLSDNVVIQAAGARVSKADIVNRISGIKCTVKDGWAFTQPQLLKIDDDTYVLSYVSNIEGDCTADGKTEKTPSPVRAATVWVRNGETWQAAFHGENLIVDLNSPQATAGKQSPTEDDKAVASANTAAASTPGEPDPITTALMAAENALWDAWKEKDATKINARTAKDIAFVDLFGNYSANKADTLNVWTGPTCVVTSFELTDGVGTSVSPTVGIVTLTGTVNGNCAGQDISGQRIYGTTVYVKDGDDWKWVFGFNSPS